MPFPIDEIEVASTAIRFTSRPAASAQAVDDTARQDGLREQRRPARRERVAGIQLQPDKGVAAGLRQIEILVREICSEEVCVRAAFARWQRLSEPLVVTR